MESKLRLIRKHMQFWATDDQGRAFQSSEELFLHTLQTVQDKSNFSSLPSSSSVRAVTAMSRRQVTELYNGFNNMSWHMPGVYRYAYDVRDVKEVKIPPACAVLTADWTDHYRADSFFEPHWETLETDTVLDINGCEYVYYQGKVRSEGKICVPVSLITKVCKATHEFAQPGVQKSTEMMDRRYKFTVPKRQWTDVLSAVIEGCPVCQATKHRRGTQPESNHSYPIPEYPFSSICIDFCDLSSMPCTHRDTEYDYVLVVVCRLTGYVIATPCQKSLTAEGWAELFLEKVVQFAGLPHTIFTDHDHLINAKFFHTLCSQAGVDVKNSPIYRPRSNGRAERAVQTVITSLRKFLMQTKKKNWVQLLPLAVWTSNDILGVVSGYSPHYLMFGRNPIGFGDCPPVIPEHGSEDAVQFFSKLIEDRRYVQEKLQAQHDKLAKAYHKAHPTHVYEKGERVWYKGHQKDTNSKLQRVWTGPGEILARQGRNQYTVATERGEVVLDSMRIKPYIPPHTEQGEDTQTPPLHYYTDQDFLIETDTYVLEKVLDHKPKRATSKQPKQWLVKYKGYPQPEWQPASSFLHDINDDWLAYNAKHGISVDLRDVRMIHSPHPHPLQDLQQLEDIGAITGSSTIQIAREQEREWTNLIQMERVFRPGNSAGQQSLNFSHKRTKVLRRLLHSNSPEKRVAACQELNKRSWIPLAFCYRSMPDQKWNHLSFPFINDCEQV